MKTKHARRIRLLVLIHRHAATSKNSFAKKAEQPTSVSEHLAEALESLWGEEKNGYYADYKSSGLERFKDFWDFSLHPTLSDKVKTRLHRKEYEFMLMRAAEEREKIVALQKQVMKQLEQREAERKKYLMKAELEEHAKINLFLEQKEFDFKKLMC
jgi:hypothetical protein